MHKIAIVGAGVAGIQLALLLQQHKTAVHLYAEKTPDEQRAGRLPNLAVRFGHTKGREQALDVDHWSVEDAGLFGVTLEIPGEQPLRFHGDFKQPASMVDMRIYQATLLEDFIARGGEVSYGALTVRDVERLGDSYDLVVVSSGRQALAELFPRRADRSPYDAPQRHLFGAIVDGLAFPDPLGVSYTLIPGHGEIFDCQVRTFDGRQSTLLIEAIPGQGLDAIGQIRYDEEPEKCTQAILEMLEILAPNIYARIDPAKFGVHRPEDVLQGSITPTVRRAYTRLPSGKFAVAVGDVHVANDPVLGQGANAASSAAWNLGEVILNTDRFDEAFCQRAEEHMWEWTRYPTEWTNAMLQPPPPHAVQLFVAAAQHKTIADELVDNFGAPKRNWELFCHQEQAEAYLAAVGA